MRAVSAKARASIGFYGSGMRDAASTAVSDAIQAIVQKEEGPEINRKDLVIGPTKLYLSIYLSIDILYWKRRNECYRLPLGADTATARGMRHGTHLACCCRRVAATSVFEFGSLAEVG